MFKIHHYAIEVVDINKVSDFYKNILDFVEEQKVDFLGEEIIFLRNGEVRIEIIETNHENVMSKNVHLCFEIKNLQEIIARFIKAGITIEEGPYLLKNGWKTVFFKGPAGEMIEFLEP